MTVTDIADIVRKVPVEEYCDLRLQGLEGVDVRECSTARLKRMLVNRGASEMAQRCIEKDELVREVRKVRNFNSECAICAEDYVEG